MTSHDFFAHHNNNTLQMAPKSPKFPKILKNAKVAKSMSHSYQRMIRCIGPILFYGAWELGLSGT